MTLIHHAQRRHLSFPATLGPRFAAGLSLCFALTLVDLPLLAHSAESPAAPSAQTQPLPPLELALARSKAIAETQNLAGEIGLTDAAGAVQEAAFGLADRARALPHREGERWLWASVTKQVAAVLVMQEVQSGRLALDAPVSAYLSWGKSGATPNPTLRQLLQHQSGLANPNDTPEGAGGVPSFYRETGPGIAHAARAAGFCGRAAATPPGPGFQYNNCDYLVLGAVLEKVTGTSFAELIDARLRQPFHMETLALAPDGSGQANADATGYGEGGKPHPGLNVATFGAAGALTGSLRDLLAFDRALMNGQLLSEPSRATLWQGNPQLGYQALGAWSFPARLKGCGSAVALVERRGDVAGIQVRNVIAPALGRAVAIFVNDEATDFGEIWQGRGLAYELLSAAFCPAPPLNP